MECIYFDPKSILAYDKYIVGQEIHLCNPISRKKLSGLSIGGIFALPYYLVVES